MSDNGGPLVDFGDLGKFARPVTVFLERLSAGLGALYKPTGIRREAKAEADAMRLLVQAEVDATDIQRRAAHRWLGEEAQRQGSIERITRFALPDIREDAKPEDMDLDWIAQFFDRARLVSDVEMQSLWARVLSGEANRPGSFGRRTVQMVSTMSKADADAFTKVCSYVWRKGDGLPVLVVGAYERTMGPNVSYGDLVHLDNIGLIRFGGLTVMNNQVEMGEVWSYFGRRVRLHSNMSPPQVRVGSTFLTHVGFELQPIAGAVANESAYTTGIAVFAPTARVEELGA